MITAIEIVNILKNVELTDNVLHTHVYNHTHF